MKSLQECTDKWARTALERGWVEGWVEGSIFPREMVAFLALCEARDVSVIVESGRQDGYSTALLAQYAEVARGRVVSIDDEPDAERAARTRARLAGFENLHLVRGDAFLKFGDLVKKQRPLRCGVLVDGPKGFEAMALTYSASAFPHVAVLGQHNLDRGADDTNIFTDRARSPIFYEDIPAFSGRYWDQLADAEKKFCGEAGARRSLDTSSIGVIDLAVSSRRRLWMTTGRRFRAYQPLIIAILWRIGAFRWAARLFYISFRWAALSRRPV